MAKEIEYKFIVTDIAAVSELTPIRYESITQAYLTGPNEGATIRVRSSILNDGRQEHFITVKGPARGMTREEWEYAIPGEDAAAMANLTKRKIEKTRYFFEYKGRIIEFDIFEGKHAGLMIAEIEVESEDEVVEFPSWFGKDVTRDIRYTNVYLSEKEV